MKTSIIVRTGSKADQGDKGQAKHDAGCHDIGCEGMDIDKYLANGGKAIQQDTVTTK